MRDALTYARSGPLEPWAARFLWISGLALAAIMLMICAPFWLTDLDTEILTVLTPAAQWLPFAVVLIVHLAMRPRGSDGERVRFWRLLTVGVRPVGRMFAAIGLMVVTFVGVPIVTILLTAGVGLVDIAPVDGAAGAALLVLPLAVGFMVFTFGEEAGWRGVIQSVLAPLGFWRSTLLIGTYWALWHLPLSLTYHADGVMPLRDVATTTVNLLFAAVAISAARYLGSSVWPAVFAHALMNMMGQYAYSNLITPIGSLDDGSYWAFSGISWVVWAIAVALLSLAVKRRAVVTAGTWPRGGGSRATTSLMREPCAPRACDRGRASS